FGDGGPLGFVTPLRTVDPDTTGPSSGRKIAIGVAALLLISAVGLGVGLKLGRAGHAAATHSPPTGTGSQFSAPPHNPPATGGPVALQGNQVRIVDPAGNNTERDKAALMVDGDPNTGWHPDKYRNKPNFGGLKPGMGVLIDFGKATDVTNVVVDFDVPGAV